MRITVIGTGYVGLVSGACFAEIGHEVRCVDKVEAKIEALLRGEMPIYEPGLDALVARNVEAGRLSFSTDLVPALEGAEAVFIAVGTPSRKTDGHADLSYVYGAAREIAAAATQRLVIVTKSTVPVGTGDEIERIIAEVAPDAQIDVASNPEFLREGAAIGDFMQPDRVVIGTQTDHAHQVLHDIYLPIEQQGAPLLFTARRTSELIKYAANAFLSIKITFINEIADLCEAVGADVRDVSRGIGLDNRIGTKFLNAGPGYGGSCFPKDTLALLKTAEDFQSPIRVVDAVVHVNETRKRAMGRKVIRAMGGNVRGKIATVLGLTFKPDTDDMREAPSLSIIQALQDAGVHVRAHDPEGVEQARTMLKGVEFVDDPYGAADGAHAVVIVTEWDVYKSLDLSVIAESMAQKVLVDLRNIYSEADAQAAGLAYTAVGRVANGAAPSMDATAANDQPAQTRAIA
ncbi:UDP-glucose/GDP-mannose dehydrogenase family protein [uncultured Sphingomonas sp.]|uniref:UDP-glucose dehydrogenase family protein n=1 Tax=uncultured Sphingomonas sp. TaxID=158754 RepID=UPI0025FBBCB0|nr:UDP-glucose/GDP-mannose dehydrogenase family protein [uncultured Sphingomonas sp.]